MRAASTGLAYTVVVPTVGRPSLRALLETLAVRGGPAPAALVLVDDRPQWSDPLPVPAGLPVEPLVLRCGGRGPAAARNLGWQVARTPWVVFLDDDVLLPAGWARRLAEDLAGLPETVAGSQARLVVPVPERPTDWARNTAGLAGARWATAEMAYRRAALAHLGGFDERFPRAYREDADLAIRALAAGYGLVRGHRQVRHPVRPADRMVSVRVQAGNADDALMRRKHGPGWRAAGGIGRGRFRWHAASVLAGALAAGGALTGRRRAALAGLAGWAALTAEFAARRIAPGPRDRAEVLTMLATSAAIPPVAVYHRLRGMLAHRRVPRWRPPPRVVLFDRDGTLVHDVPYNGSPAAVRPVDGARLALDRLRARGIRVGVVTNQSGVARGLLSGGDVDAVHGRLAELLGPFDAVAVCPHAPDGGCGCRKPAPGLIHRALADLGVPAGQCAVVGDIGSDVHAALAAGARPVLVPTAQTLVEEVEAAPEVAADLGAAVDLLLGEYGGRP
jgi:histidinol-phosphate phosphatase family protein